jgi:hypothetical protein
VRFLSVNLGHYVFHEPWNSRLLPVAQGIPGAEVEVGSGPSNRFDIYNS